jgi:hypothetical protein
MPINYQRWERRDGVDRNEFALAVLDACRRTRATNPKVRSSRYYWADGGNTVAVLTEGEPGFNDYNPDPDPDLGKALFRMNDLARMLDSQSWADAGLGTQNWERSGSPTGTS